MPELITMSAPNSFAFARRSSLISRNNELRRIHLADIRNHAQTQRTRAGDNHNILDGDARAIHGMLGAAIRLNQQGLFKRQILGNSVEHRRLRVAHILRHAAVVLLLKTEGGMGLAHPVTAGFAELAFSAWNDLIGNDPLPKLVLRHHSCPFLQYAPEIHAPE